MDIPWYLAIPMAVLLIAVAFVIGAIAVALMPAIATAGFVFLVAILDKAFGVKPKKPNASDADMKAGKQDD